MNNTCNHIYFTQRKVLFYPLDYYGFVFSYCNSLVSSAIRLAEDYLGKLRNTLTQKKRQKPISLDGNSSASVFSIAYAMC